MTTREKYSLTFVKTKLPNSRIARSVTVTTDIDHNNVLTFITQFGAAEVTDLIADIALYQQQKLTSRNKYSSDTIDWMLLEFNYPNMLIDGWYKIPMVDFKALLEEWLGFISN